MQVWAHRGLTSEDVKENTLSAFANAIEHGIKGIELDVRLCGSGEVICFHDPSLWRMSRLFIAVGKTDLVQLRKQVGYHIPTLREVFETFGKTTEYILDLKTIAIRDGKLERKTAELINEFGLQNRVIISSSNPLSLCKAHALTKGNIELALVVDDAKFRLRNHSYKLLPFDTLHVEKNLATKKAITRWKSKGFKVRVWTVNTVASAEQLCCEGADGIITDRPNAMGTKDK